MIQIMGEGMFILLIIAFIFKENIFVKYIKDIFKFFICNNKENEISIMYNFDCVLIYIMCKFHVATTFH